MTPPPAPPPPVPDPGASAPSARLDKPADKPASASAPSAPAVKPMAKPSAPKAPERPAFMRTDLQMGTGREAQKGKGLSVNYTGWLYDPSRPDLKGRMFDTSKDRGPFNFVLGKGDVIPGWDQGFDGMKIGGRRRLIIPPNLAYGVDGAGNGIIPPNATLVFEMELLDVQQ
jgi:FKBP-type peptidyl-prolyl cis-trans isomerase FkpA